MKNKIKKSILATVGIILAIWYIFQIVSMAIHFAFWDYVSPSVQIILIPFYVIVMILYTMITVIFLLRSKI